MHQLLRNISKFDIEGDIEKSVLVSEFCRNIEDAGYKIVELNDQKPWGAYVRIDSEQADEFVGEFFPGLTPIQARLGVKTAELSPKILIVSPGQRLSWQYHNRRAERWAFLTDGRYYKSASDEQGKPVSVTAGHVIQFAKGERHRLAGVEDSYTIVAEIWQHVDKNDLSDEDDIVRLADDYNR